LGKGQKEAAGKRGIKNSLVTIKYLTKISKEYSKRVKTEQESLS
jgi:hypothetical protein